jgi:cholesterol transport system auxiliary component
MISPPRARPCRLAAAGLLFALLAGCNGFSPPAAEHPSFYSLDSARSAALPATPSAAAAPLAAPTLIVSPPHAESGFDSRRIIFLRQPHRLEYYAHSEWADTPARMLAPLVIGAIEASGAFRAVILTPSTATGELRLDTQIVRLQHELGALPSQVRFTLRAYLVESATRAVLASREFEATAPVASENPYGAVLAANTAVHAVLGQLAGFCAETASQWHRR